MLPYSDGQTVRFTNGIVTLNSYVQKETSMMQISNCAGCDIIRQEESITFKFRVGFNQFVSFSIDNRPDIFLNIFSPEDNYMIGAGFDFKTQPGVALPLCNAPRQSCIGTISFNGRIYNDVLEIVSGASGQGELTKAYYNVNKGLIAFRYGNGMTYSLAD